MITAITVSENGSLAVQRRPGSSRTFQLHFKADPEHSLRQALTGVQNEQCVLVVGVPDASLSQTSAAVRQVCKSHLLLACAIGRFSSLAS
jgi:hypothetical protein